MSRGQDWGLGQGQGYFRVGGQPDNCSQEKLPPVRVRVWRRVSFMVWGAIFFGGNSPRTAKTLENACE